MAQHSLSAQPRTLVGRAVKALRHQGQTPANIFGKKVASLTIQVNTKDFTKLYAEVGESTLVYLRVEGESDARPVLVREVVYHPVSGQILHVSFNQVDLKEKVTAPVAIELVGEAPAESNHLGILVQQLSEVEVEALPTDMPERVSLDVSGLAEVGAQLLVSDIQLASNITIQTAPDTIVAKIEPLAKEEVVAPPPAAPVEGEVPAAGVAPSTPAEAAAPAEAPKPEAK